MARKRRSRPENPNEAASPWEQVLAAEELSRRDLNMESLAERVGVSASYLRLVRQGKRSPSVETAGRLFEALGYQLKHEQASDGPDLIATDGRGRVVHVELKTRTPRPSVDERLDGLLEATEAIEAKLTAMQRAVWDAVTEGVITEEGAPDSPSKELEKPWAGLPDMAGGLPALSMVGTTFGLAHRTSELAKTRGSKRRGSSTPKRRRKVEALLAAVPDEDLPLATAYLTALVDRARSRSKDD